MQKKINPQSSQYFDLSELVIILWSQKFLIMFVTIITIFFSGYYGVNRDKVYTSQAIFKLDLDDPFGQSNVEFPTMLNMINDTKDLPVDLVYGRVFIEALDEKVNFKDDSYFNRHNPYAIDAYWKVVIKKIIGWQASSVGDINEEIWQSISKNYKKNVFFSESLGDGMIVTVKHSNPIRASNIANEIMEMVIEDLQFSKNKSQDDILLYLTKKLSDSLFDLEIAQNNLKNFTLENSAIPFESFSSGILELEALRDQWTRTTILYDAIEELLNIIENKDLSVNNYNMLREKFPIVDQVEFRRVLGQSEIISSWTWPTKSSVKAILDTLTERKNRLKTKIDTSQSNAKKYGVSLEAYKKLERDVTLALTSYEVITEQVSSHSVMSGFRPDMSRIYENAAPSISPSIPSISLVLVLGAILGFILGCAIASLIALKRGICYSTKALVKAAQTDLIYSSKPISYLSRRSLVKIKSILQKKPYPVLRDLSVEFYKSNLNTIILSTSQAKHSAADIANLLAVYMQSDDEKFAIIDFSFGKKKINPNPNFFLNDTFMILSDESNITNLVPNTTLDAIESVGDRNFIENLDALSKTFDTIIVCANNEDVMSLIRAVDAKKVYHISSTRRGYTKEKNLSDIRSIIPIQGLLHE
jgi:uncharacterized protein involved in exopolysaccharide biosynthesis